MRKTLQQLFQEFGYECEFVKKIRPATLQGYKQSFQTFNKLLPGIALEQLNAQSVISFFKILQERKRVVGKGYVKSGVRKSTVASYWSKLNVYFKWLVIKGYLSENPLTSLAYPAPSYEDKKFLGKDELEKILSAIYLRHNDNLLLLKRNLVLFHLLVYCGLRKEEVMLLQTRDIDFEKKMVTVRGDISKSKKTRQVPLHSSILMHVKDYLRERRSYTTQYLIVSSMRDDKLSYDGLKHLILKLQQASGVRFHLHQFRHTFAVNFLRLTNNIFKLKELLGHSDIRMTTLYLRCLPPEEMRADIESLNIDKFL